MNENQYLELLAMLTVIYKKLDELDRQINKGGILLASHKTYLERLRNDAKKIITQIEV